MQRSRWHHPRVVSHRLTRKAASLIFKPMPRDVSWKTRKPGRPWPIRTGLQTCQQTSLTRYFTREAMARSLPEGFDWTTITPEERAALEEESDFSGAAGSSLTALPGIRRRMMITNGFRLTRELVESLNDAGLTDLQISVDGVKLGDGTPGPIARRLREIYIEESQKTGL